MASTVTICSYLKRFSTWFAGCFFSVILMFHNVCIVHWFVH